MILLLNLLFPIKVAVNELRGRLHARLLFARLKYITLSTHPVYMHQSDVS